MFTTSYIISSQGRITATTAIMSRSRRSISAVHSPRGLPFRGHLLGFVAESRAVNRRPLYPRRRLSLFCRTMTKSVIARLGRGCRLMRPSVPCTLPLPLCCCRRRFRCCSWGRSADSDEAGRVFRFEAGHPFRFESGHHSDLKVAGVALPGGLLG